MTLDKAAYVQTLKSWVGLNGDHKDGRESYAQLIFPYDTLANAIIMAEEESSCALTGLAGYRAAGVKDARLFTPYWGHTNAVTLIVQIAQALNAWVTPNENTEPPGDVDICLVKVPEHVFCCTAKNDDGTWDCVEGGTVTGHVISGRQRIFVWWNGGLWGVKAEAPYLPNGQPNGRMLVGYAQLEKMVP